MYTFIRNYNYVLLNPRRGSSWRVTCVYHYGAFVAFAIFSLCAGQSHVLMYVCKSLLVYPLSCP